MYFSGVSQRASRVALVSLSLALFAASVGAELPREGTFEANWSLEGHKRRVDLDGEVVSTYRLKGTVDVERSDGLSRSFESICVGVSDEETGGIARCAWTDADGDSVIVDFVGRIVGPMGTSREATGAIVGGTGEYEGILGLVATEWLFWESAFEDGKITGRDTRTTGSWKFP